MQDDMLQVVGKQSQRLGENEPSEVTDHVIKYLHDPDQKNAVMINNITEFRKTLTLFPYTRIVSW